MNKSKNKRYKIRKTRRKTKNKTKNKSIKKNIKTVTEETKDSVGWFGGIITRRCSCCR